MNMLLKYEMKKTLAMKLIILGITAVVELFFLGGVLFWSPAGSADEVIGISVLLLVFLAFGGVMLIGIQSVLVLHRDMNTKQGYMLYMTPRNSYQILGAKTLENGLSLVLAGAFFFLLGLLDITLLLSRVGQLETLWNYAKDFLRVLNSEITLSWQGVLCLVVAFLSSWLATVSVAYLADIVSAALLNGKRFNGLVSFIFFILLSILLSWLQNVLGGGVTGINNVLLVRAGIALVFSALMYVASATIMERYLSV